MKQNLAYSIPRPGLPGGSSEALKSKATKLPHGGEESLENQEKKKNLGGGINRAKKKF